MTQGQFFKRSLTGFNSEFSFSETSCLTKAEEPSLSYYLPIAGGRIIGFIPFPRVLVLCEMQSVSSRIWIRVAVSISYDDNHYTTGTSKHHGHLEVQLITVGQPTYWWTLVYWNATVTNNQYSRLIFSKYTRQTYRLSVKADKIKFIVS